MDFSQPTISELRRAAYEQAMQLLGKGMLPSAARASLYQEGFPPRLAHTVLNDLREHDVRTMRRIPHPLVWAGLVMAGVNGLITIAGYDTNMPVLVGFGFLGAAVGGVLSMAGMLEKRYRKRRDPQWNTMQWHVPLVWRQRFVEHAVCVGCKRRTAMNDDEMQQRRYTCRYCGARARLTD